MPDSPAIAESLNEASARLREEQTQKWDDQNGRWLDNEMDKLDMWAEDRRASLKAELEEFDSALNEARKAARLAPPLAQKIQLHRDVRALGKKREDAWRSYDQASRDIDRQKDTLLDELISRLEPRVDQESLFTFRWHLE